MSDQTKTGKAFEYALLMELNRKLSSNQKIILKENTSFENVKNCFNEFEQTQQITYKKAAEAAIRHLITLEPRLERSSDDNDIITLSVQSDQSGTTGDIRDIIIERLAHNWSIGISAKNNHTAVKHSRLSDSIDFGMKWLGIPCSESYFTKIKPIFNQLRNMIKRANEEGKTLTWKELENKNEIYSSVLEAFTEELHLLNEKNPNINPQHLLQYLIGTHDFYKIIKMKGKTEIQSYNLRETLNRSAEHIKPNSKVSRLRLPTRIIEIKKIACNRVNITFDEGWQLSLRIHNASTNVEPSLKFDIQLIGRPNSAYTHFESW
jgi:hypothetical protein